MIKTHADSDDFLPSAGRVFVHQGPLARPPTHARLTSPQSIPEVQVPGPKAIPSSTAPLIPGKRRVRVHQGPQPTHVPQHALPPFTLCHCEDTEPKRRHLGKE
ncbi:uncharacterized protein NFIA_081170 [Aspergillus fischeri NRRL 181]|uniref:Uncharacterized protein n=1 Tax=Neosartorya fischeri (strain ATCC 1020 / DSM 3700 / CBS 544.65 / FGSC A1164 / JCM 1740 / NRRL 181 / WB 181) TaxID=331117 RepID=A1DFL6_NEOFI|nr:uncharacterized protein NFIA_081170 [Aspergillus fischeri NRRL 181]EAW18173.1 hypothetical protein NFIA_081170 [Aspergillus fischeri NRRL 181]KAG2025082.1 hypothetical protein GB937_003312 [Aspergillus fischeri]